MMDLERSPTIIREAGFSAWLLCNVFHRDEISDRVLGVPAESSNTRPWYCFLYPDRPPLRIVHRIEASILSHLPGDLLQYSARSELESALSRALPRTGTLAVNYSKNIPVGSYLDHGTALLLESLGAALASAENLVARFLGTVGEEGGTSHDAAAAVLYRAIADAWSRLAESLKGRRVVTEGDVQEWLQESLRAGGLQAEEPAIVAAARHTADPHFSVQGRGAAISPGDLVQIDVWGKQQAPGAVYADIAWAGVCAASPAPCEQRIFEAVRDARETAVSFLEDRLAARKPVTGADVDRAARDVLAARGFSEGIKHRTGHSIGTRVHGYGVNLDSVEFPDERELTEGSCFSVEPGVYLEEVGMRSEIDCIIRHGRLHVSGASRQTRLLTVG